jgi:hypothetical protein
LMLAHQGALLGRGWGCLACGLPPVGVVAVVCDDCLVRYERDPTCLRFFCVGHPGTDGRRDIVDLNPVPFEHDLTNHPELQD